MMPELADEEALPRARILLNALALRPGPNAARYFLENLITTLPRVWPAAELVVLVREGTELPPDARTEVLRMPVPGAGFLRVWRELTQLPRLVERAAVDVVISPNESVPKRLSAPVVVVAQNLLYHCAGVGPLPVGPRLSRLRSRAQFAFYRRQMPRAFRRANAVVVVSAHAAERLRVAAGLDPRKVTIAPYGADRLPVHERIVVRPRRLVIIGAVAHYKRIDVALEALAQLRLAGGDYELLLAGEEWPGYAAVVDAHADRLGVGAHVTRLGGMANGALAELLAGAHASVALSRCESFGIPVLESMRAGVPVVVADDPWSEEFIGATAIRVDADDPEAVANGIRALEDDQEWQSRSAAGRRASEPFTWHRMVAEIAAVAAGVVTRA
jgi:glycosyltransferase involved in cell wall biosynthesis